MRKSHSESSPRTSPHSCSLASPPACSSNGSPLPDGASAPPCFYFRWCARQATLEKCGRSVCGVCAENLRGQEYPLRRPGRDSTPLTGHAAAKAAAEALDMRDDKMQTRARNEVARLLFRKIREADPRIL